MSFDLTLMPTWAKLDQFCRRLYSTGDFRPFISFQLGKRGAHKQTRVTTKANTDQPEWKDVIMFRSIDLQDKRSVYARLFFQEKGVSQWIGVGKVPLSNFVNNPEGRGSLPLYESDGQKLGDLFMKWKTKKVLGLPPRSPQSTKMSVLSTPSKLLADPQTPLVNFQPRISSTESAYTDDNDSLRESIISNPDEFSEQHLSPLNTEVEATPLNQNTYPLNLPPNARGRRGEEWMPSMKKRHEPIFADAEFADFKSPQTNAFKKKSDYGGGYKSQDHTPVRSRYDKPSRPTRYPDLGSHPLKFKNRRHHANTDHLAASPYSGQPGAKQKARYNPLMNPFNPGAFDMGHSEVSENIPEPAPGPYYQGSHSPGNDFNPYKSVVRNSEYEGHYSTPPRGLSNAGGNPLKSWNPRFAQNLRDNSELSEPPYQQRPSMMMGQENMGDLRGFKRLRLKNARY